MPGLIESILLPVKRHGVDGLWVTLDGVGHASGGDVPDEDAVIVAGAEQDVLGRGMPQEVEHTTSAKLREN